MGKIIQRFQVRWTLTGCLLLHKPVSPDEYRDQRYVKIYFRIKNGNLGKKFIKTWR